MFNIGKGIREARIKSGMSQKELADKMNISLQAISKWENEISEPSAQHLLLLFKTFGNDFINTTEPITKPLIDKKMTSIKEIYKIGRGPSSSHTIGPERACQKFKKLYPSADFYKVVLYGSLSKTGIGHGTNTVIEKTLEPTKCEVIFDNINQVDHPNTMDLFAYKNNSLIAQIRVISIGGGEIIFGNEGYHNNKEVYKQSKFSDISKYCKENGMALWQFVKETEPYIWAYLYDVWEQMKRSIKNGLDDDGILPGGLGVHKKAKQLFESQHIDESLESKENRLICAYAFATSEQNASGETIVTAPTCGSAGVLPAVLYYEQNKNNYSDEKIIRALATAGLIGNLIRTNASISGAECGCQAEIGSACAMASAALGELFELSIDKIEYSAEIALEHHLGLTCDPICGLVQIPCIERNAVAAMRAINAVSLASLLWNTRKISFDSIINTMRETGRDLSNNYKETSEGGMAKNYKI